MLCRLSLLLAAQGAALSPRDLVQSIDAADASTCSDNSKFFDEQGLGCKNFEFHSMLGDSHTDCSADTLEQCGYTDPGAASQSLVAACPSTCDVCSKEVKLAQRKSRGHCEAKDDEKVSIGGDPIFHKGDQWIKFDIEPKTGLTGLLHWKVGSHNYQLLASTLLHTNSTGDVAADEAQWFKSVVLKIDDEQALVAEIGVSPDDSAATRTMAVNLDGKLLTQQTAESKRTKVRVSVAEQKQRHTIRNSAPERLRVSLEGGLEFDITSAAAFRPYKKNKVKQAKFAHLNMHFQSLPEDATGLVAELAGKQANSKATTTGQVLVKPHGLSLRSFTLDTVVKNLKSKSSKQEPDMCSAHDREEIFNHVDENGNGSVDMKELMQAMEGSGMDEEAAQQIMNDIDENEDGQITLVEFNAYMACNYCGDTSACPISKAVAAETCPAFCPGCADAWDCETMAIVSFDVFSWINNDNFEFESSLNSLVSTGPSDHSIDMTDPESQAKLCEAIGTMTEIDPKVTNALKRGLKKHLVKAFRKNDEDDSMCSNAALEEAFNEADTDCSGLVEMDELAAVFGGDSDQARAFMEFADTNGDGQLSLDELKEFAHSENGWCGGGQQQQQQQQQQEPSVWTNDGVECPASTASDRHKAKEMLLKLTAKTNKTSCVVGVFEGADGCDPEVREQDFECLDTDSSGNVDRSELEEFMASQGVPAEYADQVMGMFDENGDGTITKNEFNDAIVCLMGGCQQQQQQQQQEEKFVALDGKCAVMIGHVMNACDSDGNGAIDACEMYSCVILMEGNMRQDKCPSTYDPRPLSAGTCKPCLADYQNGAESKFYPLDFYDLPLCASSANTDAQKKQLSSKAKGAVSAATLRTTFKTIHRALKKQRAQAAAK
jgi:Ca2+-binding EF-hand superfamily protein